MMTDKWKKKLILVKYGLSTLDEIERQTKRFHSVLELRENLILDGSIYIIKLVPKVLRPKLKNFIVWDSQSMEMFYREVEKYKDFIEIWVCRDECENGLPIHGRFAVDEIGQYLELVQADTARKLECISLYPHIQAKRLSWGWHYVTEGTMPYRNVAIEIECRREVIEKFILALESKGIISMSLEFRVYRNEIIFTDWDTSNDRIVLNELW